MCHRHRRHCQLSRHFFLFFGFRFSAFLFSAVVDILVIPHTQNHFISFPIVRMNIHRHKMMLLHAAMNINAAWILFVQHRLSEFWLTNQKIVCPTYVYNGVAAHGAKVCWNRTNLSDSTISVFFYHTMKTMQSRKVQIFLRLDVNSERKNSSCDEFIHVRNAHMSKSMFCLPFRCSIDSLQIMCHIRCYGED